VEEAIEHLRGLAAEPAPLAVYAGDGETFEGGEWLERFLAALEREAGWLATTTFSEYLSAHEPRGLVYLPSTSYPEMGEWSLTTRAARSLEEARAGLSPAERGSLEPWLAGGFWRSFLVRYPEAGHLHKRAAYVSEKVHRTPRAGEAALRHLWRAQTGAPYWHGAAGGAYLNFLRSAAYRNLIEAENAIEPRKYSWLEVEYRDLDLDGYEEVIAESNTLNLYFHTRGGALVELDHRPKAFNLIDTFARRPEPYHPGPGTAGAPIYDAYERRALVDHFVGAESRLDELASEPSSNSATSRPGASRPRSTATG
jgi:alpha-amylase